MKNVTIKPDWTIGVMPERSSGIEPVCIRLQVDPSSPGITYERLMADVDRRRAQRNGPLPDIDLDILDHLNLIDTERWKRDPSYEEWFQRQRDAAAEAARYYDVNFAASKMDWDEAEEITQPGPAPTTSDPFDGMAAFPPERYPQIDGESIAKTDRCYFCARGQYLTRFFRDPNDSVLTCVTCLYDHLRWELHEDGTLTPVPSE